MVADLFWAVVVLGFAIWWIRWAWRTERTPTDLWADFNRWQKKKLGDDE